VLFLARTLGSRLYPILYRCATNELRGDYWFWPGRKDILTNETTEMWPRGRSLPAQMLPPVDTGRKALHIPLLVALGFGLYWKEYPILVELSGLPFLCAVLKTLER